MWLMKWTCTPHFIVYVVCLAINLTFRNCLWQAYLGSARLEANSILTWKYTLYGMRSIQVSRRRGPLLNVRIPYLCNYLYCSVNSSKQGKHLTEGHKEQSPRWEFNHSVPSLKILTKGPCPSPVLCVYMAFYLKSPKRKEIPNIVVLVK